jgi:hypothetical protein
MPYHRLKAILQCSILWDTASAGKWLSELEETPGVQNREVVV